MAPSSPAAGGLGIPFALVLVVRAVCTDHQMVLAAGVILDRYDTAADSWFRR